MLRRTGSPKEVPPAVESSGDRFVLPSKASISAVEIFPSAQGRTPRRATPACSPLKSFGIARNNDAGVGAADRAVRGHAKMDESVGLEEAPARAPGYSRKAARGGRGAESAPGLLRSFFRPRGVLFFFHGHAGRSLPVPTIEKSAQASGGARRATRVSGPSRAETKSSSTRSAQARARTAAIGSLANRISRPASMSPSVLSSSSA
jgi:hypothetical protein